MVQIVSCLLLCAVLHAQPVTARVDYIFKDTAICTIEKLPVNSAASDFGIISYRDGYLFSSSRESQMSVRYVNAENAGLFDLYYFSVSNGKYSKVKPFARSIRSRTNEASVAISSTEKYLVYTGNYQAANDRSAGFNLALFETELRGSKWEEPRMLYFCRPEFNYEQAFITDHDSTMYFVSDCIGGRGGKDIWISKKVNNEWTQPVNAGTDINTSYDETFPFVSATGSLYFSSNRPGGKGGLDLYVIAERHNGVAQLVQGIVNTAADEFGFWINADNTQGFFTSNRGNNPADDNIYSFTIDWPDAARYDTCQNPQLCYTFFETASSATSDTALMKYTWLFSDETFAYGCSVYKCFDTLGIYPIHLEIRDSSAGDVVISNVDYEFMVASPNYIDFVMPDSVKAGENFVIDTRGSHCDGFEITEVKYDFGSGYRASGATATHTYNSKGEYFPEVYFIMRDVTTGNSQTYCMIKQLTVF